MFSLVFEPVMTFATNAYMIYLASHMDGSLSVGYKHAVCTQESYTRVDLKFICLLNK